MTPNDYFLVFTLNGQRFGINVTFVERVIHSVAITEIPKAPEIIMGVINVHGTILPIINMYKRLNLPGITIGLNNKFVIIKTDKRSFIISVDDVLGSIQSSEMKPSKGIWKNIDFVEGIIELEDGLLLINNIEKLLLPEEEEEYLNIISKVAL